MSRVQRLVLEARRFGWRLLRFARTVLGIKRTTYVEDRTQEYHGYWERAAKALSATIGPISDGVWEIRRNGCRSRVANHMVPIDDPVILRLAGDKPYCYERANRLGIPVCPHRVFTLERLDEARAFMAGHTGACVVKPASQTSAGVGVTTQVRTRRQLESAAALASLYNDELLIEAMVPAESCRLLYLDGELIHAVRRRGVRIVGDGRSTIEQLLEKEGLRRLVPDTATALTLESQGFSLQSCPKAGIELVARYLPAEQCVTHELRTVYNESITALVCPALARNLSALVRDIGSRFAGIDVLTNDPTVALRESRGVFLELNTTPGLHHHYVGADEGSPAVPVLRYLLERAADSDTAPRAKRFPYGDDHEEWFAPRRHRFPS